MSAARDRAGAVAGHARDPPAVRRNAVHRTPHPFRKERDP